MQSTNKAAWYVAIAIISWSTVATLFKIALSFSRLTDVLLIASFTSFVVFALVALVQNKLPQLIHLKKKDWLFTAMLGFLNPVAYYLVLFKAYSLLPAHVAQPVNYTWPVVLLLILSAIQKKRISALQFVGLGISLTGLIIISLASSGHSISAIPILGIMIAFLSAFLWAIYWILNSHNTRIDSILLYMMSFFFGTFYLVLITLFFPNQVSTSQGILSSIYIGLFEMSIPFIFFGMALRKTKNPVLINQLCYLSPFMSLIIIHFTLNEDIRFYTWLGLILIVAGIVLSQLKKGEESNRVP
jgi:drug/metabolite transporter (DMT)-like permease